MFFFRLTCSAECDVRRFYLKFLGVGGRVSRSLMGVLELYLHWTLLLANLLLLVKSPGVGRCDCYCYEQLTGGCVTLVKEVLLVCTEFSSGTTFITTTIPGTLLTDWSWIWLILLFLVFIGGLILGAPLHLTFRPGLKKQLAIAGPVDPDSLVVKVRKGLAA